MYGGDFNLNIWLRSFVRADLVDMYEERCLEIVKKYKGQQSLDVLIVMFTDINKELIKLGETVLENFSPIKYDEIKPERGVTDDK